MAVSPRYRRARSTCLTRFVSSDEAADDFRATIILQNCNPRAINGTRAEQGPEQSRAWHIFTPGLNSRESTYIRGVAVCPIDFAPPSQIAKRETTLTTKSDEARARAEASFKKEERAKEGAKAMMEYQANSQKVREKTERLRALRLAKEAADKERTASAR
jgi:hypothetical protein